MKNLVLPSILFLSFGSNATINDKDLAKCTFIDGELKRLECYDNLAKKHNLFKEQAKPLNNKGLGDWKVQEKTNPLDDSKTVTLMLFPHEGTYRKRQKPVILARCSSGETDFYIAWNDYLGREAIVTTRVGNNKANTSEWSLSTDSKSSFHPKPIKFLKSMLNEEKLVAQITPYNESPTTAIFNISGLNEAIKPLKETCKW